MSTQPPFVPSADDKFPDCFPRNPKACSTQGNAFFDCLNKHSDKIDPNDTEASARALKACLVSFWFPIYAYAVNFNANSAYPISDRKEII